MHKLAEKMADCLKAKVEGMGIDNIEGAALEELGKWVDIIKDIACYDKDMRIIKAMDEAEENEEKMKYIEEYEDYPEMDDGRRGYRGQPRSKTSGRFMSRGDGRRSNRGRRGYEEPWDEMYDEMEYMRDVDRPTLNRMYYSGSGSSGQSSGGSGMSGGNMGGSEGNRGGGNSRYENARRGYEEKKTMGADKQEKMKSLEEYMKTIAEELTQAVEGASPEEKTMIRGKLTTLAQKVS